MGSPVSEKNLDKGDFVVNLDPQIFPVVFLPDGRPAPAVLTDDETIGLLRLDAQTGYRTLKYYRDEGLLVGIRIGRKVRYPLTEIMRFLAQKIEQRPK